MPVCLLVLDEPTSGLDARSAALVVKLLRQVASAGRTICATIHQVSVLASANDSKDIATGFRLTTD